MVILRTYGPMHGDWNIPRQADVGVSLSAKGQQRKSADLMRRSFADVRSGSDSEVDTLVGSRRRLGQQRTSAAIGTGLTLH